MHSMVLALGFLVATIVLPPLPPDRDLIMSRTGLCPTGPVTVLDYGRNGDMTTRVYQIANGQSAARLEFAPGEDGQLLYAYVVLLDGTVVRLGAADLLEQYPSACDLPLINARQIKPA